MAEWPKLRDPQRRGVGCANGLDQTIKVWERQKVANHLIADGCCIRDWRWMVSTKTTIASRRQERCRVAQG